MKEVMKRLERMGYELAYNPKDDYLRVFLQTNKGYVVHLTVFAHEVTGEHSEHAVDYIVARMNKTIKEAN